MSDGPGTASARQVRDGAGRWKKGISGNPSGRPRGARNHATTAAAALLDGEAEALTRKAVEAALGGDSEALRLCLQRILPARRDRPVRFACRPLQGTGEITPEEARAVRGIVETETEELERRVAALEGGRHGH
ncbi:hypothetical protein LNKW23_41330 [Paralimibaculum aggregatum]|uniref:DUF5681 domain-containing protein n=1 Tax=Paralimibaculum aggregatum TaxID=3036245 RepID=A0ABQ6LNW4_9RHOB|nr:DUF5681 domain-containing protein [Limibaculum sp. NKW23]GMG84917.1 hypothetical protein LNKW23_41330 [Limibaculum sp. NKW23]